MKKKILIIIGIVLVVLLFVGYKGYYYLTYRPENISDKKYDEFMKSFEIHNDININKKEVDNNNYLIFRNIKIRNDFKDYVLRFESEDNKTYELDDENGNIKAIFRIGIENNEINDFLNEGMFDKKDKEMFLSKHNISNDKELFDFIIKKHNTNSTIFTSVGKMKENAMIQYLTFVSLSNPTYITKINGDYTGYIIGKEKNNSTNAKYKNINTVRLLNGNKIYSFGFWISDDFTEEYLKDIIETIIIENKDINTFTKTWEITDKKQNGETGKTYITLKQFQSDEKVTVEVYNSFVVDKDINKYYEFTFQNGSNTIEDNIKSIFDNASLVSVKETDKVGLDQVQESIK